MFAALLILYGLMGVALNAAMKPSNALCCADGGAVRRRLSRTPYL